MSSLDILCRLVTIFIIRMKFHKNKFLTTVAAAALALAVGACSSSSDDDEMTMMTTPPATGDGTGDGTGGGTAPALSELATAQADAAAAATAAMTAAGTAAEAATAAMAAVANLATTQTNATAGALAYEAHTAAGKAMAAYEHAKAASEAAAAAEEVTAAVEARIMAVEAGANAVKYAMTAAEKGAAAEEAAVAELMIDGVTKSVGDTSVMADTGSYESTTGKGATAQTVITGLLDDTKQPKAMNVGGVDVDDAVAGTDENPDTTDKELVKHVQAVAGRSFDIGKTLDSSDDTARLMLITQYAGTKTAYVYNSGTAAGMPVTGTKVGYLSLDDLDPDTLEATHVNNVALKSAGMFYAAGTADGNDGNLDISDVVGGKTKAAEVFAYEVPQAPGATEPATKNYVVLTTESTTAGTTRYTYTPVDVTAAYTDEDGDMVAGDASDRKVRATIAEASDYKHIHFGVWAALGEAAKNGGQELSELGIGFIQNISGEGLTVVDMPNNGGGTYSGNWAATVREADDDGDGDITLEHGAATLTADFTKATIKAALTGLATLEGDIATNAFSGTKATVASSNTYSLDSEGKFTGSFSGGFYGAKAAEAGGVFAFTSEDAEAGEFSGAFGGDRK